jgi:hypothetical protein
LLSAHQARRSINANNKFVSFFWIENKQQEEGQTKISASREVCASKHNKHLEQLIYPYKKVFQQPKGFPHEREFEHEIQLLSQYPLPSIGLHRQSILGSDEVKKQL